MPITLAEASVGRADKVTQEVIDTLRRGSQFMDELTFDDAVSPGVGGSTLTYGYLQLQTPSTAAGRAINSEYTANEAKKVKKTVDLKIFGGASEVDRVIQEATTNEIAFQLEQKTLATRNYFQNCCINGSKGVTVWVPNLLKVDFANLFVINMYLLTAFVTVFRSFANLNFVN